MYSLMNLTDQYTHVTIALQSTTTALYSKQPLNSFTINYFCFLIAVYKSSYTRWSILYLASLALQFFWDLFKMFMHLFIFTAEHFTIVKYTIIWWFIYQLMVNLFIFVQFTVILNKIVIHMRVLVVVHSCLHLIF